MILRNLHHRVCTIALASLVVLTTGTAPPPRLPAAQPVTTSVADTAVFAGGCFWGIEGVFEHLKGVGSAVAGYAGGSTVAPSYEQVSSGTTGHAESVLVIYNPGTITYAQLLQVFFTVAHDPTELNRQGPDQGTQYRSIVFFRSAAQQHAAEGYVAELNRRRVYPRPIVTQIVPLGAFYPAEAYHQGYMALHPTAPYIVYNDAPKVERLRSTFPAWYRER
ncbi:MAG: peptide-methionine (S)-S-oxide reductase MsrA [Gemmatimonadales bacterium]